MRDAVARLVDERVLPIIGECFESARFPRELLPALAELGVFGCDACRATAAPASMP